MKGRIQKTFITMLCSALFIQIIIGQQSTSLLIAQAEETGLCEHHMEHTEDCGYAESSPCEHEHTEVCYMEKRDCVHEHIADCYLEEGEGAEPENCSHECSEEEGCITKELSCDHEKHHDEVCGYVEAQNCGYECDICKQDDDDKDKEELALKDGVWVEGEESTESEEEIETETQTETENDVVEIAVVRDLKTALPRITTIDGLTIEVTAGDVTATQDAYGQIILPTGGSYTISGIWTGTVSSISNANRKAVITVQGNGAADITLNGVQITANANYLCAFVVADGATANITLADNTVNILYSEIWRAGLEVADNGTLVIDGNGRLEATAKLSGAGIGGCKYEDLSASSGGTIYINGGEIIATGGEYGAGIGRGYDNKHTVGTGVIRITGGTVTAIGGIYSAGIGSGYCCTSGTIVIEGNALVFATAGNYASAIGNGRNAGGSENVTKTQGIIFEGTVGTVYGAVTLTEELEIPSGYTLEISASNTLQNNGTITNRGIVTNNGAVINNGTIYNYGTWNNDGGSFTGNAFKKEDTAINTTPSGSSHSSSKDRSNVSDENTTVTPTVQTSDIVIPVVTPETTTPENSVTDTPIIEVTTPVNIPVSETGQRQADKTEPPIKEDMDYTIANDEHSLEGGADKKQEQLTEDIADIQVKAVEQQEKENVEENVEEKDNNILLWFTSLAVIAVCPFIYFKFFKQKQ